MPEPIVLAPTVYSVSLVGSFHRSNRLLARSPRRPYVAMAGTQVSSHALAIRSGIKVEAIKYARACVVVVHPQTIWVGIDARRDSEIDCIVAL